jgi:2-iminobutanoate/2-iminopropanoate deaminase
MGHEVRIVNIAKLLARIVPVLAITTTATGADSSAAAKAEFLNSPQAAQRDLPFSEAVRAGDFLFLSGALGFDDATGKVVPGGIVPETRQTLKHIKDSLERHGASLSDVIKCTVFLADIAEWPAFNNVYREVFKKPYPARSALGASGLALGARVEVECIAYVPGRKK